MISEEQYHDIVAKLVQIQVAQTTEMAKLYELREYFNTCHRELIVRILALEKWIEEQEKR